MVSPSLTQTGKLAGIVTITDLDRAVLDELPRRTTAIEIGVPRSHLIVATPDESVGEVLARMGTRGLGRMPVVADDDPDRLLGMVRRRDIIQAYNMALSRRAEIQHRTKRMRVRNIDGTEFIEVLACKMRIPQWVSTLQEIAAHHAARVYPCLHSAAWTHADTPRRHCF